MASWEEFSRIVAEAKAAKKLDPVGHEDDDVDNDGDSDSSDSYLKKRRATVGAAIAADRKKKVEEGFVDPEQGEAPSGRSPLENVSDHPKASVRKKAVKGFKKQMEKEYGGKWRSRSDDPVKESYDDLDEAKVDEKLPEHERATARDKRSGHNLPGSGTRRVRRAEHEERRGKPKRWWDDDGDGIGWEKGEVKKESVEQIDEIAPLVAAGLAAGGVGLAANAIGRGMKKFVDTHSNTKPSDYKNQQGLGASLAKKRQLMNQINSYQPEGEMVEEDKEYRREMRKAAARERAEERKEKGGKAAKSPGREGPSAGKTYADYQEISIKAHDKLTKKNKNPIGLVTKEEIEQLDEKYVDYRKGKLPSGRTPQQALKNRRDYNKARAKTRANYDLSEPENPDAAKFKARAAKAEKVGKEMDDHTSLAGAIGKVLTPGLGNRSGASPRISYGEPNTERHQLARYRRGDSTYDKKESFEIEEGMSLKDFKANRKKLQRKEASVDAEKRGHVGKEWHNTGRKYTPDEAKSHRAKMSDDERSARHRVAVDPDDDRDENTYSADKTKNPKKLRKQQAMGEGYLEEKSLSRAQQRFMGMVYAAKKGGTPASPEVAKAAEGMSKKAARDFAKTKHEGLPEKKEDTKEELSLVQRIIAEATDAQWMAAKARREERQKKQQDRLRKAKLATAANRELKALKDGEEETPKGKSEEERKEAAKKRVKRGKSGETGGERAAATSSAVKMKLAKMRKKEEEERKREAEKKARRRELRSDIRNAWSSSTKVGNARQDTSDMSATVSNLGNIVGGVAKTGIALGKFAVRSAIAKRREQKNKKQDQKEEFSNWREEFIFEVDDQSVQNEKQKVIDVSKKKNKIEINPNMSEGCGCEEKEEKKETPQKDMRDLPTKVNLLKTKARAMGARNPIVMVASEETDNIQEIAPLLAAVARVAAPAVARGVTSKVAGSAVQGSLRAKAAEIIGKKAGEKMQNMFAGQPTQNKQTSSSNDEVQKPLGGIFAPEEFQKEDWQSVNRKDKTDGLSQKAVNAYRRENPGSKLQTAVTEKKPTGKRAERRKSFCRRMNGMKERLTSAETARDPDSRINKALRRWNCN